MAAPKPKAVMPDDPRNLDQMCQGPLIKMRVNPDVGNTDFKKLAPGKYSGRTIKAGKS